MSNVDVEVRRDGSFENSANHIQQWIEQKTHGRVWNLGVVVNSEAVYIRGRCKKYYTKQLALQAALEVCAQFRVSGESEVHNAIEVSAT